MRRLLPASILVAALAVAVTAAGCSYVNPPALSMSTSINAAPYYSLSREDLLHELDQPQTSSSLKAKTDFKTAAIAELLTNKVYEQLLKRELEELKVTVTDADKQFAEQLGGQQGTQPSAAEIDNQAKTIALARVLGEREFASGAKDLDAETHALYDRFKSQLTTPAELCLHVIVFAPGPDAAASSPSTAPPTDADFAQALARAQAAKARLATEDFAKVADEVSALKDQGVEGGDIGCRDQSQLEQNVPEVVAAVANLPLNTVSEPIKLQDSYAIVRVDERRPESVKTYESVRDQLVTAAAQGVGRKKLDERQQQDLRDVVVMVDPRFGFWDTTTFRVQPPPGAGTPTVPTTPTTAFNPADFGQLPGVTGAAGAADASATTGASTTTTTSASSASTGSSSTTTTGASTTTTTRSSTGSSTTTTTGGANRP